MSQLVAGILDRARYSVAIQLSLGALVGLFFPTVLLAVLATAYPAITGFALYAVSAAYLATCALMLIEANLAVRRHIRPTPPIPSDDFAPEVTLLVVAYLPNEVHIVIETVRHLLDEVDIPGQHPQVLLAYNTPERLAIEDELEAMAAADDRFDVVRVIDSTSKAENVMGALSEVRGDIVAILDTDHHLRPDAARIAVRWFDVGYDIVQGRCVVRNARENLLTRLVAFEFETIYGVAHAGRSLLVDTGIFGGANGWWRTSVLRGIGLDHRMLTEDIDSSLRSLLSGYRIIHERNAVSTELAPTTLKAWWRQRTRWAQGWFQVTLRHGEAMRTTSILRFPTRAYWTTMLVWREAFPLVSLQIFSVLLAEVILGNGLRIRSDPFLLWTTAITLGSAMVIGAGAWRVATKETKSQINVGFATTACLLMWPYTLLKNAVAIAAMVRELVGDRRWLVTNRTGSSQPAATSNFAPVLSPSGPEHP